MNTQPEKKILLIEPPFLRLFSEEYSLNRAPLSLGYLACTIRERTDWEVMIYNSDFIAKSKMLSISYLAGEGFRKYLSNLEDPSFSVWQEIRETIREFGPSIVGITSKSQNFAATCVIARIAKQVNPGITVIVGGPHPSMAGQSTLGEASIDMAVRGEGEDTMTEILEWAEGSRSLPGIDGIIFREDGQIRTNRPRQYIEDLDSLCLPHENLSGVLKDYEKFPPIAFRGIFATRGCPFNCSFCGSKYIWTRAVRHRSPSSVISEIKKLISRGVPAIHFEDDTFGVNKNYIRELCGLLMSEVPRLEWSCEINVKLVDEEIVELMARAGCHRILIGIESGNNEMLKTIRKNITVEEAFRASEIIIRHGIDLSAFFIIGFPEETEETLSDTISAIKKIYSSGGDVVYSIFTPYPGTELFEYCREKGLVRDDFNVSLYNHQSPMNNFTLNISDERFREIASELEALIDRLNRRAWLRRAFSLSTIKRIREFGLMQSIRRGLQLFGLKK
jgi:radical SAM superfamily enzyme YgiQ (UPF0313 family)